MLDNFALFSPNAVVWEVLSISDQETNAEYKTAVSLTSAEEISKKLSKLFGEEIAKVSEGKPWIADCRAHTCSLNEL